MINVDLVIIGGGSAGLAAAIEAKKAGIDDILILEKDEQLGGILNQCIHNGFGITEFKEELTGPEYLARFVKMAQELLIPYRTSTLVTNISKDKVVTYSNDYEGVVEVQAKAIILAVGCYERTPGSIALPGSRISGILTAGTAQKYLNIHGLMPGKKIVILGSGDIGLIMARRLTLEGAKVECVCEIMPYSNGLNRNISQCLKDFNIPLYLSTTISRVFGKDRVEKVEITQVDDKMNLIEGTSRIIECDTLILSIGLIPYLSVASQLDLAYMGRQLVVDNYMQTSIPGIFVCGNCLHVHDVVDFVTDEGRSAGIGASKYIKNEIKKEMMVSIKFDENISYIIPQSFAKDSNEDITIKFRVKKPINDSYINIYNKDNKIYSIFKPALIPSEMVLIKLKNDLFKDVSDVIEVKVEAKK